MLTRSPAYSPAQDVPSAVGGGVRAAAASCLALALGQRRRQLPLRRRLLPLLLLHYQGLLRYVRACAELRCVGWVDGLMKMGMKDGMSEYEREA